MPQRVRRLFLGVQAAAPDVGELNYDTYQVGCLFACWLADLLARLLACWLAGLCSGNVWPNVSRCYIGEQAGELTGWRRRRCAALPPPLAITAKCVPAPCSQMGKMLLRALLERNGVRVSYPKGNAGVRASKRSSVWNSWGGWVMVGRGSQAAATGQRICISTCRAEVLL